MFVCCVLNSTFAPDINCYNNKNINDVRETETCSTYFSCFVVVCSVSREEAPHMLLVISQLLKTCPANLHITNLVNIRDKIRKTSQH